MSSANCVKYYDHDDSGDAELLKLSNIWLNNSHPGWKISSTVERNVTIDYNSGWSKDCGVVVFVQYGIGGNQAGDPVSLYPILDASGKPTGYGLKEDCKNPVKYTVKDPSANIVTKSYAKLGNQGEDASTWSDESTPNAEFHYTISATETNRKLVMRHEIKAKKEVFSKELPARKIDFNDFGMSVTGIAVRYQRTRRSIQTARLWRVYL